MARDVIEQRLFRRLSVQLRVSYVVPSRRGEAFWGEGRTGDLSAGGVLLALAPMPQAVMAELIEGDGEIEVVFALAAGEPRIASRCRVVWVRMPEEGSLEVALGLRFVDLEADVRDRIHAFVVAHAQ